MNDGFQSANGASTDLVVHERRGPVHWMTINRPDKRNAINGDVIAGLRAGLREAQADSEIRALVLTASGSKAFCAGADLQPGAGFVFDFSKPTVEYAELIRDAQGFTKPIIARVNGACMAGGMGLLCLADLAVAVDTAVFGLPEVKVGVFPMQVMSLLQRIAPRRRVREWALTGEPFNSAQALDAGLLNYVVPAAELDAKVDWLVERLVDKSPTAIRRGKYALRAIEAMSFDEAIAFTESQIALLAMTEDAREGLAAFSEKRKAVWTGR
jgi:enoyl-CoA hydratase/carnithine racemase